MDEEEGQKDSNFMSRQLKEWLDDGDYAKSLKFSQSKMSKGQRTSMFYAVITSYCLMKVGKEQECKDVLNDYKTMKPTDTTTCKYMVAIYNNLGSYNQATQLLEYILNLFPNKKDLQEQLFYSYVREGMLLKQQN